MVELTTTDHVKKGKMAPEFILEGIFSLYFGGGGGGGLGVCSCLGIGLIGGSIGGG